MALRSVMGNKTNLIVKIDPSADNPISTARAPMMMDTASRPPSNIPLPPNMPSTHPAPPRSKQNHSTWIVLFLLIFFIGGGIGLILMSSGGNSSDTPSTTTQIETDTPQSVVEIIPPTDAPRSNAVSDIEVTVDTQGTIEAELTRLVADNDQQTEQAIAIETELGRLSVIALTTEAAGWTSTPTRTPTATETTTPTRTRTATPTTRASNTPRPPTSTRRPSTLTPTPPTRCSGSLVSRLEMGGEGRVTRYPNQANNMRDAPSTSGDKIGEIPPLGEFYVVSGPRCNDGYAWYEVNYRGVIGWTAESGDGDYWLEPWEID